jgi:FkbM family methyltransferase
MNDTSQSPQFWPQLTQELLSNCYQWLPDNVDLWRFPEGHPLRRRVKDTVLRLVSTLGFYKRTLNYGDAIQEVIRTGGFDAVMDLLADDASRELLVKLIAYRILGPIRYRLPMNTPSYWQLRSTISRYVKTPAVIKDAPSLGSLDEFQYEGIRLIAHPLNILNTFVVEQYRCRRAGIGVQKGDIVIDGGACWGDTSLYFARQAERVFAYECILFNIGVFQRNMDLNPELASRVTLIPKALWESSGKKLAFTDAGPGSRADTAATGTSVETHTIDDLVGERKLDRVDFIKMDIEGAETNALLGAEQTIRRFQPRLAICVYHSLRDLVHIPEWIASLGLGYRLYLDHFTIYGEESILFAERPSN